MSFDDTLSQVESLHASYSAVNKKPKSLAAASGEDSSVGVISNSMRNAMIDDLRRARLEKWCRKRGRKVKFELKDKIALRKWFYTLDADGSGEVIADELHDPMLSTGILRTKNQVYTTLLSMDTSKSSNGVNFDMFQKAIHRGEFADKTKLDILQGFCENQHGFGVDTLFGMERRKLLFKAIVDSNLSRENDVDAIWNRSNSSYEGKLAELRQLEESHAIAVIEQDGYIDELFEALMLNKRQRAHKEAVRQENLRKIAKLHEEEVANRSKLPPLLQKAAAASYTASNGENSNDNVLFAKTPGKAGTPSGAASASGSRLSTSASCSVSTTTLGGTAGNGGGGVAAASPKLPSRASGQQGGRPPLSVGSGQRKSLPSLNVTSP